MNSSRSKSLEIDKELCRVLTPNTTNTKLASSRPPVGAGAPRIVKGMSKTVFGVALYATEHARACVELAQTAEALGYQRFWIGDSHMIWRELYVLAGAIAAATKNIAIGPGVTHPAARHLTVTASAMATLHELTEGRAFLGFGVGATGPGNIGMKPATIPELEASIAQLKMLLAGDPVETQGSNVRCLYPPGHLPIFIGTRAPRAMKITCRLADGFIYTGEMNTLRPLVQNIRAYTAQAGRPRSDVQFIYRMPCSIGDDNAIAREAVKGVVARAALTHLGRLENRGELHDDADHDALHRLRRLYDTYHHMGPEHDHLVREEWVDRFALAGTPENVRERAKEYIAAGIDELTIVPCGDSKVATLKHFYRHVMEKL